MIRGRGNVPRKPSKNLAVKEVDGKKVVSLIDGLSPDRAQAGGLGFDHAWYTSEYHDHVVAYGDRLPGKLLQTLSFNHLLSIDGFGNQLRLRTEFASSD